MSARTAIALRHVSFEDLGTFAEPLAAAGYALSYVDVGVDPIEPTRLETADLLIVLGGPIGVCDDADFPFLRDELAVLRQRLAKDRPTLGVCLGAQLIARALGAAVYAGPEKEIGWKALSLTTDGRSSPLKHLEGVPVLHWHGDTFQIPRDATLLASTESFPNQAFMRGSNILGLQFHAEADPRRIERWLIGHSSELAHARISPAHLRNDTKRYGPDLEELGRKVMSDWLAGLPGSIRRDGDM